MSRLQSVEFPRRRRRHRTSQTELHKPNLPQTRPTLLWIDDYEPALAVYKAVFEHLGFRVLTASRGSVGLQIAASANVDAVIVDYEMPEMDGGMVAATLKRRNRGLPVVMFSGSGVIPHRVRRNLDAVCDKAKSHGPLLHTLKVLLARRARLLSIFPPPAPASDKERTVA